MVCFGRFGSVSIHLRCMAYLLATTSALQLEFEIRRLDGRLKVAVVVVVVVVGAGPKQDGVLFVREKKTLVGNDGQRQETSAVRRL